MKSKTFNRYYCLSIMGVLILSAYPIYMSICVFSDMIRYGWVRAESYPKYIIPYAPIALSLIIGVALMPVMLRYLKKYALLGGSAISIIAFFSSELLLEKTVTVMKTVTEYFLPTLESWQMVMCYIPPDLYEERTWTEVNVLMGEYSPAFKLHFYFISLVLITSILNCVYGYAKIIRSGDKHRLKSLVIQSVTSVAFLGMCIWACFTAFYRNGDITVSELSAVLMCVFFILFGVTVGVYTASFLLGKKKSLSLLLPAAISCAATLLMYIGEMILLSGHVYRFGYADIFRGIPGIVLAPVDIAVIIFSGAITAIIAYLLNKKRITKSVCNDGLTQ